MSLSAEVVSPSHVAQRRGEPVARPDAADDAYTRGGLRGDACLGDVETLMHALAGPPAGDLAAAMVREHLVTGGKRLRARLALAALEALGAPRRSGVAWAAACELLHNATLVHDDLQDGDLARRGHPTTWAVHGAAQAINAGDLLLMLPFLALEHLPALPERRWALASATARQAAATVRGQTAELALTARRGATWPEYRVAVEGKTGALFGLPVEGAAILAGLDAAEAAALAAPFRGIGVLFQLQDDVLDLYGEKGRERTGSDLREGKVSALVVEHLALHPGEGAWLRALLALPRDATPDDEVRRAMERFRAGGALERVLGRIDREARAVAHSPALDREPGLRALADELVQVALAPVAHVRATRTSRLTLPAVVVTEEM